MEGEGSRSLRALGGGGHGWLKAPWKPNWRADYGYTSSRGSSGTTTPGTICSTPSPCTNTSGGGFTPSPQSSRGFDDPLLDLSCTRDGQNPDKQLESISCLLQEFCVAKGDVSILERWISEIMSVNRLIADEASAVSLLHFAGIWIRALTGIAECIRNKFLTDMLIGTTVLEEEERHMHINSARFAEACIMKMLPFVDAIVSPCFYTSSCSGAIVVAADRRASPTPAEKLQPLIGVREAVSRASQDIRLSFCSTSSQQAKRITDEMASLLLTKEDKLGDAIWNTMEEVRTRLLAASTDQDDDDSWWGAQTPQGSTDIHKVTRAITSYINLLSTHYAVLSRLVEQAVQFHGYVPKIDSISPLTSLMTEIVLSLEERLAQRSRSFTDQSLRFVFLINNSYFIWQQLYPTSALELHMSTILGKIDNYIKSYLQVSWAPVLLCLCNSTPLCLGRYSPLPRFESEFLKTYTTQKLWKVPDPKLRRRLRVVITEEVISSFTRYLESNNISPSRITPQDLMDMLQELFEG